MNEVRKLINVCKASGFKSAYTLLVLATLIIYASIEALFAGKISTFEFGVQPKGNNYNFLAILFILKILFQLLSTFLLVKFGFHSGEKLQEFILEQINQKRKLLSSDQSKVLIKRYLLNEPLNIANLIMIPLMLFICEALVTIFLGIIVLMNISNELLFILLQVLISIFIFAYFSKSLTHKWGEKRKVFESRRIESINTYTDNFAFFALNKFQNKMVKRILEDSHSQFSYNSNQAFIDKVPRIFLELLIFTVVVLSFVSTGENNENINIVIGEFILLGYVGFRLFPASNRLLMSLQSINFALQGFEDTLLGLEAYELIESSSDNVLSASGNELSIPKGLIKYKGKSLIKWPEISLNGSKTKIINVTGENGSGKSLFISAISGCLEINSQPDNIVFMPQKLNNMVYSVIDLDSDLLSNVKDQPSYLPNFSIPLSNLSGGQQQKILMTYFEMKNANLVFMDEPTSALDKNSRKSFWENMKSRKNYTENTWFIIVTHDEIPDEFSRHILEVEDGYVNYRKK